MQTVNAPFPGDRDRIAQRVSRDTASEGVTAMIASQLLFVAEYLSRLDPRPRMFRPEGQSESPLRRLSTALGRRLRRGSLPTNLSEHLYRDIGIDPPPKRREHFWPW